MPVAGKILQFWTFSISKSYLIWLKGGELEGADSVRNPPPKMFRNNKNSVVFCPYCRIVRHTIRPYRTPSESFGGHSSPTESPTGTILHAIVISYNRVTIRFVTVRYPSKSSQFARFRSLESLHLTHTML